MAFLVTSWRLFEAATQSALTVLFKRNGRHTNRTYSTTCFIGEQRAISTVRRAAECNRLMVRTAFARTVRGRRRGISFRSRLMCGERLGAFGNVWERLRSFRKVGEGIRRYRCKLLFSESALKQRRTSLCQCSLMYFLTSYLSFTRYARLLSYEIAYDLSLYVRPLRAGR